MNTARKKVTPIGILKIKINYFLSYGYYALIESNEAGNFVGKISS